MKKIVYGEDARLLAWLEPRLEGHFSPTNATAFGVEDDNEIIGVVAFNYYSGTSVHMNVAALPGRYWLTKEFLWRSFAYPFLQLKCNRVTALVREDNIHAQKFDENLGFVREGLLRKESKDGQNMIVYGMLKEECRFLEIKV